MKKFSLLLGMLFLVVSASFAQRTITGTISDEKGETLLGASVLEKGTTNGIITDENGKFTLNVSKDAQILIISFAGYNNREVTLGAETNISVSLTSAILQEIIVTGTGAGTDRRKVAVDVQTLSAKNLPPTPTASIDQALVGKIAGAQIASVNGSPGAKVSILLRGVNTINRGTQPMTLVDGIEMGATDLGTLDLNSIERVEVVQGAAASALYGAQGANGVIQMFTKRGKKGRITVDVNSSITQSDYLNIGGLSKASLHGYETNSSNQVVSSTDPAKAVILGVDPTSGAYNANLVYANGAGTATQDNKPYDQNLKYYDHFKLFFVSAPTINNSLSISSATDNFDFSFSLSNNYQKSNLLNNGDLNRTNGTVNIGVEIIKGLKFRTITQLAYTKSTVNDEGGRGTIYAAFNSRPFANYEATLPDGTYPAYLGDAVGVNGLNPFFINEYSHTDDQKIDLLQSFNLNYQPFKWLELDAKYGLNFNYDDKKYLYDRQTENANVVTYPTKFVSNYNSTSLGEVDNLKYRTTLSNFITGATVRYDFLNIIKASTYGAFDYRNRVFKRYITNGLNFPQYQPVTGAQASTYNIVDDYTEPFITYGFLVDQRFDIGEFAGVSGGFRSDYSSAYGSGSTAFTFPHANGYLRLSTFDFWKNTGLANILPEFKLRGGFGKAGIQPRPFDRYPILNTNPIGSRVGFYTPPVLANTGLGVEVSSEIELGADLSITLSKGSWFNNITFSPTYWSRTTDNAIGSSDLIPSSGVGGVKDNIIGLKSNGFQMVTRLTIADKKDFQWNLNVNFGKQTSEVANINGSPIILTSAIGSTGYIIQPGNKIGQLFGYLNLHDVNAVDPNGNSYIPEANKANYEVASSGWVVNKTNKLLYATPNLYSFGDPNPSFILNFLNGFTYKNFLTFNVQVDWVQGSHLYNQTKEWMYRDGIHSDYTVPVTINGETGAFAAYYRGVYTAGSNNGTKSYFYEDASFVRLRNVEVAFDVAKFLNVKFARSLIVSLSGRNLLTFTKYTGLDPEINSSNVNSSSAGGPTANGGGFDSAWDRGTDHNTLSNLRQYSVGLRLGF